MSGEDVLENFVGLAPCAEQAIWVQILGGSRFEKAKGVIHEIGVKVDFCHFLEHSWVKS